MRVQVQFFDKDGEPGGRRYTYEFHGELQEGDVVRLDRGQRATVVALDSDYDGDCRSIVEVIRPDEDDGEDHDQEEVDEP